MIPTAPVPDVVSTPPSPVLAEKPVSKSTKKTQKQEPVPVPQSEEKTADVSSESRPFEIDAWYTAIKVVRGGAGIVTALRSSQPVYTDGVVRVSPKTALYTKKLQDLKTQTRVTTAAKEAFGIDIVFEVVPRTANTSSEDLASEAENIFS